VALLRQEEVLCIGCQSVLPQTNFHHRADNEAALRIAGRVPFEHATAFGYFSAGGLLQHLLHRLKYQGRKNIGFFLGVQAGWSLGVAPWVGELNAIVPVPLHPRKQALRGFNQSALIAAGMGSVLQLPVLEHALRRTRHTESQTSKSREERVLNVRDAFIADASALSAAAHVLLVDDVLTTGATLEAASGALLSIPGLKLSICTIALAGF
jgi:ComF family protein